jgi:predicted choloylglycine hydrolase
MIRVLELSGDPRELGRQHGEQVVDRRPLIEAALQRRLAGLRAVGADWSRPLTELLGVWRRHAPATLETLRGIAEVLHFSFDDYLLYSVGGYLVSRLRLGGRSDVRCTTWAASGRVTAGGAPLLAKNRDQAPDELALQCLARVRPARGYPYLCLTSAGSPAVYSSGINVAGLAIVDTHVPATLVGPGITRYSLMMDLLETCADVPAAMRHLPTVPHMGNGTLTLADAQGNLAVFEIAHLAQAVIRPDEDFVVSTNHFTAEVTRRLSGDDEPAYLPGSSEGRHRQVADALRDGSGQVDLAWSQKLMALHGSAQSAICRHPEVDATSVTISASIYAPRFGRLHVTHGNPCQVPFEAYQVIA